MRKINKNDLVVLVADEAKARKYDLPTNVIFVVSGVYGPETACNDAGTMVKVDGYYMKSSAHEHSGAVILQSFNHRRYCMDAFTRIAHGCRHVTRPYCLCLEKLTNQGYVPAKEWLRAQRADRPIARSVAELMLGDLERDVIATPPVYEPMSANEPALRGADLDQARVRTQAGDAPRSVSPRPRASQRRPMTWTRLTDPEEPF